jgi:hypothetical protein
MIFLDMTTCNTLWIGTNVFEMAVCSPKHSFLSSKWCGIILEDLNLDTHHCENFISIRKGFHWCHLAGQYKGAGICLTMCDYNESWPAAFHHFREVFFLGGEAIGTAATPGLLCQSRVIVKVIVEKQVECRLAGETEVLGENLLQRHFCPSQNPTWSDPDLNPGRLGGKPALTAWTVAWPCCEDYVPDIVNKEKYSDKYMYVFFYCIIYCHMLSD